VDESGISRSCFRTHARSLRGKRVHGLISGRRFKRTNIVAGYCDGKILGEYCYTGTTTAAVFEEWFCTFLLPETRKGDCIIMDNARFHNKKRLLDYARVYGVLLIFLPPYSPDYSPIEKVWANVKRFLRNYISHFDTLQSAIYWYFATALY
jgi:transposase